MDFRTSRVSEPGFIQVHPAEQEMEGVLCEQCAVSDPDLGSEDNDDEPGVCVEKRPRREEGLYHPTVSHASVESRTQGKCKGSAGRLVL